MGQDMSVSLRTQIGKPVILLLVIYVIGTVGFKLQNWDGWSWLDCSYMTVVTLTTVGYGDVLGIDHLPHTKVYTMGLMLVGMGVVLYAISSLTAFVIEGELTAYFSESKMIRKISKLNDHYIICGAGATGHFVVDEFCKTQQNFVVIDNDPHLINELRENYSEVLYIQGDATEEEILQKANIEHARGLAALLSSDKDNLFLVVTARALNNNLQIAARAVDKTFIKKLENIGADIIVSPPAIGGMRLASEILRPHVVTFLDQMLRDRQAITRFGGVTVPDNSGLVGLTLGKSNIAAETGLLIIAMKKPGNDSYIYNPPASTVIQAGTVLIVIGSVDQIEKLKQMVLM